MLKRLIIITVTLNTICFNGLYAQDDFQEFIEKVAEDNIEGYFQPFASAFNTAINSALYHTAGTHGVGGFDITIKAMAVFVPDDAKNFTAKINGMNETWSTIFGPENDNGGSMNPGGLDLQMVPLAVPQASIGLGGYWEIMGRFFKFSPGDFGDISLYGIGLKHNLKKYFKTPGAPDLSIQAAYQIFKAADIVDTKSLAINAHISKSLLFITIYGGAGLESTTFNLDYTEVDSGSKVSVTVKEQNNPRLVGGISLKLGLLNFNIEANFAKYKSLSGGVGITFR